MKQLFAWLVGLGVKLCERLCGSSSQTVATSEELDLGLKQHCIFILDCFCSLSKQESILPTGLASLHFHHFCPWHLCSKRMEALTVLQCVWTLGQKGRWKSFSLGSHKHFLSPPLSPTQLNIVQRTSVRKLKLTQV